MPRPARTRKTIDYKNLSKTELDELDEENEEAISNAIDTKPKVANVATTASGSPASQENSMMSVKQSKDDAVDVDDQVDACRVAGQEQSPPIGDQFPSAVQTDSIAAVSTQDPATAISSHAQDLPDNRKGSGAEILQVRFGSDYVPLGEAASKSLRDARNPRLNPSILPRLHISVPFESLRLPPTAEVEDRATVDPLLPHGQDPPFTDAEDVSDIACLLLEGLDNELRKLEAVQALQAEQAGPPTRP